MNFENKLSLLLYIFLYINKSNIFSQKILEYVSYKLFQAYSICKCRV